MVRMLTLLLGIMVLSACSPADVLKTAVGAATGGSGPKFEAQVGRENTKALVVSERPIGRDLNSGSLTTGSTETVNINNRPSIWMWLLALLGWFLATPGQIWRELKGLFKKDAEQKS